MPTSIRIPTFGLTVLCTVFLGLCAVQICAATEPPGPAVPIAEATGKTGAFQANLSERSPLSKPADVARRMGVSPGQDYDLSKETFTLYVPREPGDGGKYGVMVSLNFREYGDPPAPWEPVLEKYHLIWIGAQKNGDDRELTQRIGLMLDAAHNVQKMWPVDEARVYDCITTPKPPAGGVGLEYPDVFQGSLNTLNWYWVGPLPVSNMKGRMWSNGPFLKRPEAAACGLDRTRSRFFMVDRLEAKSPGSADLNADVVNEGFLKSGFKHAKMISVPTTEMGHYHDYSAGWFEQAVQFVDEPLADTAQVAAMRQTGAPATQATTTNKPAPAPQSPADEKTIAAQKTLSLAKSYIAAQSYDAARSRLAKVITDYPDTPAAKEAKSWLQEIRDK